MADNTIGDSELLVFFIVATVFLITICIVFIYFSIQTVRYIKSQKTNYEPYTAITFIFLGLAVCLKTANAVCS
jgi:uncharacterized membrane protein YwzB